MKPLAILILAITLTAIGCDPGVRQVSGPELMANFRFDPLDCLVYRGGDDAFYYFDRAQFKTTTHFKVKREEVELPPNLRIGQVPVGMHLRTPSTRPASGPANSSSGSGGASL